MLDFIKSLFSANKEASANEDQGLDAGFIYVLGLEGEDIHPGLEN